MSCPSLAQGTMILILVDLINDHNPEVRKQTDDRNYFPKPLKSVSRPCSSISSGSVSQLCCVVDDVVV